MQDRVHTPVDNPHGGLREALSVRGRSGIECLLCVRVEG